jgi:hypothetical protein
MKIPIKQSELKYNWCYSIEHLSSEATSDTTVPNPYPYLSLPVTILSQCYPYLCYALLLTHPLPFIAMDVTVPRDHSLK